MKPQIVKILHREIQAFAPTDLSEIQKKVFTKVVGMVELNDVDDLMSVLAKAREAEALLLSVSEAEVLVGIFSQQETIKLPYLRRRFGETFNFHGELKPFEQQELLSVRAIADLQLDEEAIKAKSESLGIQAAQLISMKFQANLQRVTGMPSVVFRALHALHGEVVDLSEPDGEKIQLASMLQFLNYDPEFLSEKLIPRMTAAANMTGDSQAEDIKQMILQLNLDESELAEFMKEIDANQEVIEEDALEFTNILLGKILPLKLTDWMIEARQMVVEKYKSEWAKGFEEGQQCTWENSHFSELAYLKYLMDTFAYDVEQVQKLLEKHHLVGAQASQDLYKSNHWHRVTELRRTIAAVQFDIRSGKRRHLKEKNVFYPTYDSWVSAKLHQEFPENSFPGISNGIVNYVNSSASWADKVREIIGFIAKKEADDEAREEARKKSDKEDNEERKDGVVLKTVTSAEPAGVIYEKLKKELQTAEAHQAMYTAVLNALNGLFVGKGGVDMPNALADLLKIHDFLDQFAGTWPNGRQEIYVATVFTVRRGLLTNPNAVDYQAYKALMGKIRHDIVAYKITFYWDVSDEGARLSDRLDLTFKRMSEIFDNIDPSVDFDRHELTDQFKEINQESNHRLLYLYFYLLPLMTAYAQKELGYYEQATHQMLAIFDYTGIDGEDFEPKDQVVTPFPLGKDELNFAVLTLAETWIAHADHLYREDTYESIQYAKQLYQRVRKLFPSESEFSFGEEESLENDAKKLADGLLVLGKRDESVLIRSIELEMGVVFPSIEKKGGRVRERRQEDSLSRMKLQAIKFCDYPNPHILRLSEEADMRLKMIIGHNNYLGYLENGRLIYTVDRLYQEANRYTGMAKSFGQMMLGYQESYGLEKEKTLKTMIGLRMGKQAVELQELEVDKSRKELDVSVTSYSKVQANLVYLKGELDYYTSGRQWELVGRDVAIGAAVGGVGGLSGGPVGAAIGAVVGAIGAFFNRLFNNEKMRANLERKVELAKHSLTEAKTNVAIQQKQLEAKRQELNISKLTLQLNKQFLALLANQELTPAAYLHMLAQAKAFLVMYMDIAIRYAWLLQQQLAFEQGLPLDLIRFDYHKPGLGQSDFKALMHAAEELEENIEQLRYGKVIGAKPTTVLQKTMSLRYEDPLAFLNFLRAGKMSFRTTADYLDLLVKQEGDEGQESSGLHYKGHYQTPEHFGYLQQRIDRIDFQLIGIVPPAQDLRIHLENIGSSIVMAKQAGQSEPMPVALRHSGQSVVFDQAVQSTGQDYATFSAQGQLKPFEKIGMDTAWQLSMEAQRPGFNPANIFDIRMIVHYTAQHDPAYESLQREVKTTSNGPFLTREYARLPNDGSDNYTIMLKNDHPRANYALHQAGYQEKGFRDLRLITFDVDYNLPAWQRDATAQFAYIYVLPKSGKKLADFRCSYMQVDSVNGEPVFIDEVPFDLKNQFADPDPSTGQVASIDGVAGSVAMKADVRIPSKHSLSQHPKRRYVFKFFPERLNDSQYAKQNHMGQEVNTSGKPILPNLGAGKLKDVLSIKTGQAIQNEPRSIALNIPEASSKQWQFYRWEMKVMFGKRSENPHERSPSIHWLVSGKQSLSLAINPGQTGGLAITFTGFLGQSVSAVKNIIPFKLRKGDWYQLACVSMPSSKDEEKTYVELYLDNQFIWKGVFDLDARQYPGAMKIECDRATEITFDDLLVQAVDSHGNPTKRLFSDNFQSEDKWKAAWKMKNIHSSETVDLNDAVGLETNQNPEMQLDDIADIIHSTNYQYQCGPQ